MGFRLKKLQFTVFFYQICWYHVLSKPESIDSRANALPACDYRTCVNTSGCDELSIYFESSVVNWFNKTGRLRASEFAALSFVKEGPNEACFIAALCTPECHPKSIVPQTQDKNIIIFTDENKARKPLRHQAIMARTLAIEPFFRPLFDISVPARPKFFMTPLEPGSKRKYLASLKGKTYMRGTRGWLREMLFYLHDPSNGFVVSLRCHSKRRHAYETDAESSCHQGDSSYGTYSYIDLMNSTFSLVPAGRQPATYRFLEVLSAGSIPVVLYGGRVYHLPYDTTIPWANCAVLVRVDKVLVDEKQWVFDLKHFLNSMTHESIYQRQVECKQLFQKYFQFADLEISKFHETLEFQMQIGRSLHNK